MSSIRGFPPEVRTSRLVLRRQHPDDAAMINVAVNASLAHLQSSVAWAQSAPMPLPMLAARLAASVAAFDAGDAWAYAILDLAQTRVLGGAALERAEEALTALVGPDTVETGYWLRADSTGHGYATEATGCLIELAFTWIGAQHVAVCHDPANAASEGVPRRLGFRCLGIVASSVLPGRLAANGSVRPTTKVWVLDAAGRGRIDR
jgi:ribosomal-protein-serine acetyltransferase